MSTTARLRYIKWDDKFLTEKPYHLYMDPPPGLPISNYTIIPGPVETIHNLRGREDDFNLNDNGFVVVHQPFPLAGSSSSGASDMEGTPEEGVAPKIDETFINEIYLPSLESLLHRTLGHPPSECEIIWFDWRVRSSDGSKRQVPTGTKWYLDDRSVELAPVQTVHVDQSPLSAVKRVRKLVGDERADELLATKRVRLLNIWRPYSVGPVECHPLAICDGSTVPSEKLVAADAVRRSYVGEAYYLVEHAGYRWYFLDRQKREEVLVFKMYDSDRNVKAKCVPHVSFEQSTGGDNPPPPRESIEARALVFTPL